MPRKFDKTEWQMARHADFDPRPGVRWNPPTMPAPADAEIEELIHELVAVKNKISGDPTKADLYDLLSQFEPQLREAMNPRMAAEQDLDFELFSVAKSAIQHQLDGQKPQDLSDEDLRPILDKAVTEAINHLARRRPASGWPENHIGMIQQAVVNAAIYLDEAGQIGRDAPEFDPTVRLDELPEGLTDQIPGWGEPAYKKQQAGDPRLPAHMNLSKKTR